MLAGLDLLDGEDLEDHIARKLNNVFAVFAPRLQPELGQAHPSMNTFLSWYTG